VIRRLRDLQLLDDLRNLDALGDEPVGLPQLAHNLPQDMTSPLAPSTQQPKPISRGQAGDQAHHLTLNSPGYRRTDPDINTIFRV
jgi:hypothetical protein